MVLVVFFVAGASGVTLITHYLTKKMTSFFIYNPRDIEHLIKQIEELERRPYLS
ncbi:hypothetical protein [Collibacillus ludicampi]|nr:hypothetical protein [Collibacillus ludicampi]